MKRISLMKIFLCSMLLCLSGSLYAQAPPPPPGPGHDTDQPAPLGSGLAIMAALGLAYGAAKWHKARKVKR